MPRAELFVDTTSQCLDHWRYRGTESACHDKLQLNTDCQGYGHIDEYARVSCHRYDATHTILHVHSLVQYLRSPTLQVRKWDKKAVN